MPSTGQEFVASMEAINYPFLSTQFHPEKIATIWYEDENFDMNKTFENIDISSNFASLFARMTRANLNSFGTFEEIRNA